MYQPFSFMSAADGGGNDPITEGLTFRIDIEDYDTQDANIIDSVNDINFTVSMPGNIQFTPGEDGYWEADNVADYLSGPSAEHILPTTANATFTVEWLFYPTALSARYGAVISYWGNSSSTNQSWWFGHSNSNGQIHINMRDGNQAQNYFSVNNGWSANAWNHHVFAYELGNEMVVYKNGSEIDSDDISNIVQMDRTSGGQGGWPGLFKQTQTTSNNTAFGRLASIRVYDFTFNLADVTQQYNYFKSRGYSI